MRKAITALVAAALLSIGLLSTVSADHDPTAEYIAGNPTCEGGFKYENPLGGDIVDGTLTVPGGSIWIDVSNTSSGKVFSFTATGFVVSSVIVKGGPNALQYFYEPPVSSDSGLHAPTNPNNGKYYGLSHLCFFGEEKKGGEEPPKK